MMLLSEHVSLVIMFNNLLEYSVLKKNKVVLEFMLGILLIGSAYVVSGISKKSNAINVLFIVICWPSSSQRCLLCS
jgi:hypothetical protein